MPGRAKESDFISHNVNTHSSAHDRTPTYADTPTHTLTRTHTPAPTYPPTHPPTHTHTGVDMSAVQALLEEEEDEKDAWHTGVSCAGCGMSPIKGCCFLCANCPNGMSADVYWPLPFSESYSLSSPDHRASPPSLMCARTCAQVSICARAATRSRGPSTCPRTSFYASRDTSRPSTSASGPQSRKSSRACLFYFLNFLLTSLCHVRVLTPVSVHLTSYIVVPVRAPTHPQKHARKCVGSSVASAAARRSRSGRGSSREAREATRTTTLSACSVLKSALSCSGWECLGRTRLSACLR